MPTYEYECKSCAHNFEVFQSMSDDPLKECPECGKEVRRLIFGGSGVIFKGSGFYVTDKGKSSSSASGSANSKSAAKAEKTSDAAGSCDGVAAGNTAPSPAAPAAPCAGCPKSEKCSA